MAGPAGAVTIEIISSVYHRLMQCMDLATTLSVFNVMEFITFRR